MNALRCHYVSRFATKAWEFADRRVWVYDFERRRITRRSSRSLFARRGTNSPMVERRLDELIETPISNAMSDDRLLLSEVEWRLRRAMILWLTIQGARAGNALGPTPIDLEPLFARSDDQIDQVVGPEAEHDAVALIELPDAQRFFYPQIGYVPFPILDPGHLPLFGWGFAVPITPRRALAKFPKTTDLEFIRTQLATKNMFMGLSLGAAELCKLVVIPPEVMQSNPAGPLIEAITGLRSCTEKMIADFEAGRQRLDVALRNSSRAS